MIVLRCLRMLSLQTLTGPLINQLAFAGLGKRAKMPNENGLARVSAGKAFNLFTGTRIEQGIRPLSLSAFLDWIGSVAFGNRAITNAELSD